MKSATILANEDTSSSIDCKGVQFVSLRLPDNFTACDICILGSFCGFNYYPICDFNGDAVKILNCQQGTIRQIGLVWTDGLVGIKIKSSVNQENDTTLDLI